MTDVPAIVRTVVDAILGPVRRTRRDLEKRRRIAEAAEPLIREAVKPPADGVDRRIFEQ